MNLDAIATTPARAIPMASITDDGGGSIKNKIRVVMSPESVLVGTRHILPNSRLVTYPAVNKIVSDTANGIVGWPICPVKLKTNATITSRLSTYVKSLYMATPFRN